MKIVKNTSIILAVHILFILIWVYIQDTLLGIREFEVSIQKGLKENFLFYLLFIVIIGPLWEEAVFRLPLKNNKIFWLPIILGILLLLSIKLWWIKISLIIYLFSIIYYRLIRKIECNIPTITILSILSFGLIHSANYSLMSLAQMNFIEIVSTFFTQLILGMILAYIRLKYSFKAGVVYHGTFNGIILCIAISTESFNF